MPTPQTLKLTPCGRAAHINSEAKLHFNTSSKAGWWDADGDQVPVKLLLIHAEVSEAVEAYRKDTMDDHLPYRKGIEAELADVYIRLMDLAGALDLDLGGAVNDKMAYNAVRSDHQLEARAAAGGKKF